MMKDLGDAARSLWGSRAFTATAILTLALGIGAAASMFDLVNAYFLRAPAGVVDANRLVDVRATLGGRDLNPLTYLDYADLRERSRRFSGVIAYCPTVVDLGRGAETRRVPAALVSSNYFAVLGARPAQGRGFLTQEERARGGHPVAVISHRLWLTAFGGDPRAVGRSLTLNGQQFSVVGVARPDFHGASVEDPFEVWVPLAAFPTANPGGLASVDDRVFRWLRVVGRLAPGATLGQAQAEVTVLAQQLQRAGAGNGARYGLSLAASRESLLHDTYTLLLVGGVGVLFLVVCANLSNLFLARANGRRREIATRLALGAPRSRVVRRLLAESVLIGLLGGAAALTLAPSVARALLAWSTASAAEFPDPVDLGVSGALVAFVLAASVLAGIVLGLGPALKVTGIDVAAHLKEGMGGRATGRSRTRSALVISQLSLSLVLLNAGGLVFATLGNYRTLVSVPEAERVLLVSLQPSLQGYTADRTREYFRQLLDRVQRLPGVTAATVARGVSLDDASFFPEAVSAGPGDAAPEGAWLDCAYAVVSPGFFRTMGVTLSRGRDFTPGDRTGAPPVVIVNATLAQRLWGGADPVGRVLWIRGERVGREVVGLASDRPTEDGPRPFLYEPLYQPYPWAASIHLLQVRTSGDPLALLPGIEREAAALDVSLRFFNPRLLEREIAGRRFFERLAGAVMGGSGLLALLLAIIGLYGVVSNWVSECTREIGIRMALGARAGHVLAHVVGRAVKLALTGVVIGGAMALVLNRLWTAWLFGARAAEPAVLAAAVLLLIATALVAGCLPALRATRVDPIGALRFE